MCHWYNNYYTATTLSLFLFLRLVLSGGDFICSSLVGWLFHFNLLFSFPLSTIVAFLLSPLVRSIAVGMNMNLFRFLSFLHFDFERNFSFIFFSSRINGRRFCHTLSLSLSFSFSLSCSHIVTTKRWRYARACVCLCDFLIRSNIVSPIASQLFYKQLLVWLLLLRRRWRLSFSVANIVFRNTLSHSFFLVVFFFAFVIVSTIRLNSVPYPYRDPWW